MINQIIMKMIIAKKINENLQKFSVNKNISYRSKITKFDGKIIECDAFPLRLGLFVKYIAITMIV